MKTLLILAMLAALLALGCRAEDAVIQPTPVSQAEEVERLAQMLERQVTAAPEPTSGPPSTGNAGFDIVEQVEQMLNDSVATRRAEHRAGYGICFRTPEVQEWILRVLQIRGCRAVDDAELYRITSPVAFTGLKPGDLDGLVNVESLVIPDGHCGDWENPEYAASILEGFNPEASLLIVGDYLYSVDQGPGPRLDIIGLGMYETEMYPEAVRRRFDDGLLDSGLTDEQIESLLKRGSGIKAQVNAQSRAIAAAVAEVRGVENPVIRIVRLGNSVIGNPPDAGSVDVRIELKHRPADVIECEEG